MVEVVCSILAKKQTEPCLFALELVTVLLEIQWEEVIANEELKLALLETLKEESDLVIEYTLKVLVKYVEHSNDLTSLVNHIIKVGGLPTCSIDASK